jgi:hypothetical protein
VLAIEGGTAPYTCSIARGSVPAGMNLLEVTPVSTPSGLCILEGTPTAAGDFAFTTKVTDATLSSASETANFVVVARYGIPSIIDVSFSPTTSTTETVTWTTDIPSDSQVCYGPQSGGEYGLQTTQQDSNGVNFHRVVISGLRSFTGYIGCVKSAGTSEGAAKDYLTNIVSGVPFTTGTAPSSGTFDFGIQGVGPQNVVQGFPLYILLYDWFISGTSNYTNNTFKWTITGSPSLPASFIRIHWPDQQDNRYGGNSCSVSTKITRDDSLKCYGPFENTQFSVLTNVGGTTPVGEYNLRVTVITNDGLGPSHSFKWPFKVTSASFTPGAPASYPTIPALSTWLSQMKGFGGAPAHVTSVQVSAQVATIMAENAFTAGANATHVTFSGLTSATFLNGLTCQPTAVSTRTIQCSVAHANYGPIVDTGTATGTWYLNEHRDGTACVAQDDQCTDYYDGAWVYYQIGRYLGSPATWEGGANNSRSAYLSYLTPQTGAVRGYWVFPHGLYYNCKMNGVSADCNSLHQLASNAAGASMLAPVLGYADSQFIREACYMLGAKRLDYNAGGGTTLGAVKQMAAYCLGDIDQVVNNTAYVENTFMMGLAAEAIIEYYEDSNTGNGDIRVPSAVEALADHVWTEWLPWQGTIGQFPYNRFQYNFGFYLVAQGTDQGLNMLLAPMYAWLFKKTGQEKYQLEGDTLFNSGVSIAAGDNIGYTGKAFSQNYRWTIPFILWRSGRKIPLL